MNFLSKKNNFASFSEEIARKSHRNSIIVSSDSLFFSFHAYDANEQKKIQRVSSIKEKLQKKTKAEMDSLIPSIMPHTIDIKSDLNSRNEL